MRLPLVTNDTIYQQHCMLLWLSEQDYILAYVCVLSSSHSVCLSVCSLESLLLSKTLGRIFLKFLEK